VRGEVGPFSPPPRDFRGAGVYDGRRHPPTLPAIGSGGLAPAPAPGRVGTGWPSLGEQVDLSDSVSPARLGRRLAPCVSYSVAHSAGWGKGRAADQGIVGQLARAGSWAKKPKKPLEARSKMSCSLCDGRVVVADTATDK